MSAPVSKSSVNLGSPGPGPISPLPMPHGGIVGEQQWCVAWCGKCTEGSTILRCFLALAITIVGRVAGL
jgi:hypothetical protein